MQQQSIPISKIKTNTGQIEGLPKNPRFIKDERFAKLVQSIEDDPEMLELRELIVYPKDDYFIAIAGNMRFKAMQELGYKEAPCKVLKPDTPAEKLRAYTIKDNVGFGEHDWDLLGNEWDETELVEWGLEIPGWKEEEAEAQEDDYEMPEQMQVDVVLGDLIEFECEDGRVHRLLCGDSTNADDWSKLCGNSKLDLVVTDPPYNVDYTGGTKDSLKILNDKMSQGDFYQFLYDFYISAGLFTKAGGAWYIWHADSEGHNFRKAFVDAGFKLAQCLIWKKNSLVMGRQDYHWQHEPCLYGWKEGASHGWYSDRKQTTILEFDKPNRNGEHPTMKPVMLISYQIQNSSKQGDIVGDGFLGSGTTMVASHQLNRICYGMELDPKYCQVIIDRMTKLDETIQVKINGKDYVKAVQ